MEIMMIDEDGEVREQCCVTIEMILKNQMMMTTDQVVDSGSPEQLTTELNCQLRLHSAQKLGMTVESRAGSEARC